MYSNISVTLYYNIQETPLTKMSLQKLTNEQVSLLTQDFIEILCSTA